MINGNYIMENIKEGNVIFKCPKCGMEYAIGEVFYPDDLLGIPRNVIRDDNGKIIFIEGKKPVLEEDWECEKCGCDFKVRLDISPKVIYDSKYDFDEDYSIDTNNSDKQVLF